MMSREKKDVSPLLLKFGAAVALSLGGIFYTLFIKRGIKPSKPPPPSQPSSDSGVQVGTCGRRDDDHVSQRTSSSWNSPSSGREKHEELSLPINSRGSFRSARSTGNKDGYLLPEFNELIRDCSHSATKSGFSPEKETDTPDSETGTPGKGKCVQRGGSGNEQEIGRLRNMIRILKERERDLEIQLLEYYGLKEQESAVMELQNRVKINNMEAKLFMLKIQSLQADKKRLEAQVSDHGKIAAELEAAKANIKLLKKKLRTEAAQNKEQILALQERVMKLQEQEKKGIPVDHLDLQAKLQKLNDLEEEAEELRKSNGTLRLENSELAQKLECVQLLATSVIGDNEATLLKEECQRLRQSNEELAKEVEQLQADRCSDVEELVYLRWVNACLRYELRNYQPGPGKTIARDLSKTLSPKSEEKAKQLILEYGSKESHSGQHGQIMEYDSDQWPSPQNSYLTDSGEESSAEISSTNKSRRLSKAKVFGKLMRLVRGKDRDGHSREPSGEASLYNEDMLRQHPGDSPGCHSGTSTVIDALADGTDNRSRSSSRNSRYSLDIPRPKEEGSLSISRSTDFLAEQHTESMQANQLNQDSENTQRSSLVKYAEALKHSRKKASNSRSAFASF